MLFLSTLDNVQKYAYITFQKMLIILRYSTKYANFGVGGAVPPQGPEIVHVTSPNTNFLTQGDAALDPTHGFLRFALDVSPSKQFLKV